MARCRPPLRSLRHCREWAIRLLVSSCHKHLGEFLRLLMWRWTLHQLLLQNCPKAWHHCNTSAKVQQAFFWG